MKVIKSKSVTNGIRHQIRVQKNLLSKNTRFLKNLVKMKHSFMGRSSSTGRITVRHLGGGVKRLFRIINFSSQTSKSVVITTMYDPNRSSHISLNFDLEKKKFFKTLSTAFVYPGSLLSCSTKITDLKLGYRTLLKNIPTGSMFHSLSLNQNVESKFARSAGTSCQLIQKNSTFYKIRLPSGSFLTVPTTSFGTLGNISNVKHRLEYLGKAGINRLKGKRPTVRGIAMNPVDHPHGGRTNGGCHWVTPWGIPTKGKRTVKKKYE